MTPVDNQSLIPPGNSESVEHISGLPAPTCKEAGVSCTQPSPAVGGALHPSISDPEDQTFRQRVAGISSKMGSKGEGETGQGTTVRLPAKPRRGAPHAHRRPILPAPCNGRHTPLLITQAPQVSSPSLLSLHDRVLVACLWRFVS